MADNGGRICPTCGDKTCEAGHLCTPVQHDEETCEWCGALILDERHLCRDKLSDVTYICNSCGRVAVSADYLCEPAKIE